MAFNPQHTVHFELVMPIRGLVLAHSGPPSRISLDLDGIQVQVVYSRRERVSYMQRRHDNYGEQLR